MKQFSGGASQRINRQVSGDDHGDRIENRTVHIARGDEDHLIQLVALAAAQTQLAVNVLNHHDGAINDDAEVDGTNGKQVGGFARQMKKYEREQKRQWNCQCGDESRPDTDQEKNQHDENKRHSAKQVPFDGIGGNANEITAIVERTHFYIRRQDAVVQFLGFLLHPGEDILRLFALAQQNDALNSIVILFKAENTKPWCVTYLYSSNVLHSNRNTICAAHYDFSDVLGGFKQPDTTDVIKLASLRVKPAASIGIVGSQGTDDLHHREVIAVEPRGIEQHLILHHCAAEAGVVGHAGYTSIDSLDDPVFVCFQLLWRTVRAFQNVTVDKSAGAKKRGHAGGHTGREFGVAQALKYHLPRKIGINGFIKGQSQIGKTVKRNRAHHLQMWRSVHGQFQRQGR